MKVFPPAYYLDEDGYISGKDENGELKPLNFTSKEEAIEFDNQYGILIDFEESTLH